ncbi:MAG: hypothetical protein L3K26_10290 [Candidatus Hydrogenedentes bacterium]|nr:hypothetical protein [Candidatus Hydrogenedentota bacterium]
MTVQCCVCKKVKVDEAWKTTGIDHPREVSHTYCPTCFTMAQATMATERHQANIAHPVTA